MTIEDLKKDKWELYGRRYPLYEFPKHFTAKKSAEDHPSGLNAEYSYSIFSGFPEPKEIKVQVTPAIYSCYIKGPFRYSCNIGNGDVSYEDQLWLSNYFGLESPIKPLLVDDFSII